jgi:thiol-disulfide isomerase/thioredoxin
MKSNIILRFAVAAIMCMPAVSHVQAAGDNSINPESQQKKEKVKKEKKEKEPFDWEKVRPKTLSGDKDVDLYILTCDTLWERVQTFRDSITFYKLDTFYTMKDGSYRKVVQMRDEEGIPKNVFTTLLQRSETLLVGAQILLDVTSVNLLAATATLSAINVPVWAFSNAKCIKAAPTITGLAWKEVNEIKDAYKQQSAEIKKLKAGCIMEESTTHTFILPQEGELPADAEMVNLDDFLLGDETLDSMTDDEINKILQEEG